MIDTTVKNNHFEVAVCISSLIWEACRGVIRRRDKSIYFCTP